MRYYICIYHINMYSEENAELLPRMDANSINITVTRYTILHNIYVCTIFYVII